jgi:hypothetical protein
MSEFVLLIPNRTDETDNKTESVPVIHVQFDSDAIAAALGVGTPDLMGRMLETLARALTVDASEMADRDMRAKGQRLFVDGVPDGWPLQYLVAVVVRRLYPELRQ